MSACVYEYVIITYDFLQVGTILQRISNRLNLLHEYIEYKYSTH